MPVPEKFLTIQQVADTLGVHRSTVSRMLDDGTLPSIAVRGDRRVDPADFSAWLEAQKAASLHRAAERRAAVAPAKRPVGRPRKAGLGTKPAAVAAADA